MITGFEVGGFKIGVTVFLEPLSQSILSVPYSVLGVFEGIPTEAFLSSRITMT